MSLALPSFTLRVELFFEPNPALHTIDYAAMGHMDQHRHNSEPIGQAFNPMLHEGKILVCCHQALILDTSFHSRRMP